MERYQFETHLDQWNHELLEDVHRQYYKAKSNVQLAKHFLIEKMDNIYNNNGTLTRQVFNLFALDGFSHGEISAALGMSEGTSKWHVNNARKQLKGWINKEILESKY